MQMYLLIKCNIPFGGQGLLHIEFVTHSFHGCNAVEIELLPYFADVHINSAVAYNYFGAQHLVKYLIAQKNLAGL